MNSEEPLSLNKEGARLVDAIWRAYREERKDMHAEVALLTDHVDPVVREEALSLLLVKWTDQRYRAKAAAALIGDEDPGVRARAAFGLAAVSSPRTRNEDVALLLHTLRDELEDVEVRRASYEALLLIGGATEFPSRVKQFNIDSDVDWVRIADIADKGS